MKSSRRSFIATSSALGLTALLQNEAIPDRKEEDRDRPFRFKLSLAAYSYRSWLTVPSGSSEQVPRVSLFDFIDDCASLNLEGTELTSYYFPKNPTQNDLLELKRHCFRKGLDISGTAVGNDFGHPKGENRDKQIQDVKLWIDRAAILGAPVIRVFAGHQKPGVSPEESHRLMVSGLEECCEYSGRVGIHLALENHGGPTATADGLLGLVNDVKSPWFGVNLDTGNFHSDDLYEEIARVAPFAINVQVKVMVSGPDKARRPSDFERLGEILRDSGYRGYVVLEYEEGGDPKAACIDYIAQLRARL